MNNVIAQILDGPGIDYPLVGGPEDVDFPIRPYTEIPSDKPHYIIVEATPKSFETLQKSLRDGKRSMFFVFDKAGQRYVFVREITGLNAKKATKLLFKDNRMKLYMLDGDTSRFSFDDPEAYRSKVANWPPA